MPRVWISNWQSSIAMCTAPHIMLAVCPPEIFIDIKDDHNVMIKTPNDRLATELHQEFRSLVALSTLVDLCEAVGRTTRKCDPCGGNRDEGHYSNCRNRQDCSMHSAAATISQSQQHMGSLTIDHKDRQYLMSLWASHCHRMARYHFSTCTSHCHVAQDGQVYTY